MVSERRVRAVGYGSAAAPQGVPGPVARTPNRCQGSAAFLVAGRHGEGRRSLCARPPLPSCCLTWALPSLWPCRKRSALGARCRRCSALRGRSLSLALQQQQQRPSDPLAHATCANAARYPVDSSSSSSTPLFQSSSLLPFSLVLIPLHAVAFQRLSPTFSRFLGGTSSPFLDRPLPVPLHRRALRSYYAALKDLWLCRSSWSEMRGIAK